jgi:hypothetical protein
VRVSCDVDAGAKELATLMSLWRPSLETTPGVQGLTSDASLSEPTAQYEQVAAKMEAQAVAETPKDPRQIVIEESEFDEEAPTEAYVRMPRRPSMPSLPPASLPVAPTIEPPDDAGSVARDAPSSSAPPASPPPGSGALPTPVPGPPAKARKTPTLALVIATAVLAAVVAAVLALR